MPETLIEDFQRKILSRVPAIDKTEEVLLQCGHRLIRIIPSDAETVPCSRCLGDFMKQHRKDTQDA